MAKRKFKKYSTQDKVNYHKKRINDKSLSEDQRFYSHSWLSGFTDNYADHNLKALKREYSDRKAKGKVSKSENIMYQATIRGTSERVNIQDPFVKQDIDKHFGVSKKDLHK